MATLDRIVGSLLRALRLLPRPVKRLIAGRARRSDGLELDLDAQLIARVDALMPALGKGERSPAAARASMRRSSAWVAGAPIAVAEVHELVVAGADGPLRARRYVPPGHGPGLVVHFHGGGWVTGDLDTHDNVCRALAVASGAQVVAVDYRLAPEHPFPAAVDDAVAAFTDLVARASGFGADPARIALCGDSAGGHLSAMVALAVRDGGGPQPAALGLIYPATDFTLTYPSEREFARGLILTQEDMDWFTAAFIPDPADKEAASPLRAASLAGLPPAYVLTAGFDPLRDEGEALADALKAAGNTVIARRWPQPHGFTNLIGVHPDARAALAELGGALRVWLN